MITPGSLTLRAYRWQPYVETLDFVGYDFTGATMAMQLRLYPDATGSSLLSLVNASSALQGLSVAVVTTGGVPTSTVQIRIDETTLEALLPWPASGLKPGEDLTLYHDLVITGGGLPKTRWLQGPFILTPGVTQ